MKWRAQALAGLIEGRAPARQLIKAVNKPTIEGNSDTWELSAAAPWAGKRKTKGPPEATGAPWSD